MTSQEVLQLQTTLKQGGFYHGALDGIMGPLTQAAVKAAPGSMIFDPKAAMEQRQQELQFAFQKAQFGQQRTGLQADYSAALPAWKYDTQLGALKLASNAADRGIAQSGAYGQLSGQHAAESAMKGAQLEREYRQKLAELDTKMAATAAGTLIPVAESYGDMTRGYLDKYVFGGK